MLTGMPRFWLGTTGLSSSIMESFGLRLRRCGCCLCATGSSAAVTPGTWYWPGWLLDRIECDTGVSSRQRRKCSAPVVGRLDSALQGGSPIRCIGWSQGYEKSS